MKNKIYIILLLIITSCSYNIPLESKGVITDIEKYDDECKIEVRFYRYDNSSIIEYFKTSCYSFHIGDTVKIE